MSVRRRQNWLGQQRVDVPHLKSIEKNECIQFEYFADNLRRLTRNLNLSYLK